MSIPAKLAPGSAVSIQKKAYAMATADGSSAELIMYGDIYKQEPIDWWTGKPIEGQFITLSEFMEDLEQIAGCKKITIRMNSYGGDAGAANTIHNRLRELARNGAKLVCIVDGAAMSGGSLIMCACDTVQVNPSSLIMIHKCWTFLFGGYNADELRQQAEQNIAWDKMQVAIYKRKTGLDEKEIASMMADTTYMTGREAVEKGFADEVIEDVEPVDIAASADGRSLFVRGRTLHLAPGMFAPDSIPTATPKTAAKITARGATVSAAIRTEQQRLREIDQVADVFPEELVREAKYGKKACTAQELAYRAIEAEGKIYSDSSPEYLKARVEARRLFGRGS